MTFSSHPHVPQIFHHVGQGNYFLSLLSFAKRLASRHIKSPNDWGETERDGRKARIIWNLGRQKKKVINEKGDAVRLWN